jgi:hypothetical protein
MGVGNLMEVGGFSMQLFQANVLAVLAAAVLQWLVGWLWYGVIFSKSYRSLVGASETEKPANPGGVMALIFICNLVLAFALAKIVMLSGVSTVTMGMFVGIVCGLGFVVPPLLAQHVSEGKPFKLFGINSIYWLIAMGLSGSLLAMWH